MGCQRWLLCMSAMARVVYNRHARPEQTPICFHMETTVTTGNIGPQVFLPMGSRGRFGARNRSPDQERLQSARGTSQSARDVETGSPRQMVSYAFFLHVCALCAHERRNREGAGLPHCSPVQDESVQNCEQVIMSLAGVYPSASEEFSLAKVLRSTVVSVGERSPAIQRYAGRSYQWSVL